MRKRRERGEGGGREREQESERVGEKMVIKITIIV